MEPPYLFRAAAEGDVSAIAELFCRAYEDSSHECKSASYIRQLLSSEDCIWTVCEAGGEIVAVMCALRERWNRSYEICYGITHPSHRGRGLARRLFGATRDRVQARDDCELIVGHPRNLTMYEITKPMVAVGYDGGIHVANGQREFHLITLAHNPQRPSVRVLSHDEYPSTLLVGPPGDEVVSIDGCRISMRRDPSSLSGAIHLRHIDQVDESTAEKALIKLIATLGPVLYVGLQVLADKQGLIGALRRIGFKITAFLPAWHHENGRRYDCVMLVRSHFDRDPISHGFAHVIEMFRDAFEGQHAQRGSYDEYAASLGE